MKIQSRAGQEHFQPSTWVKHLGHLVITKRKGLSVCLSGPGAIRISLEAAESRDLDAAALRISEASSAFFEDRNQSGGGGRKLKGGANAWAAAVKTKGDGWGLTELRRKTGTQFRSAAWESRGLVPSQAGQTAPSGEINSRLWSLISWVAHRVWDLAGRKRTWPGHST